MSDQMPSKGLYLNAKHICCSSAQRPDLAYLAMIRLLWILSCQACACSQVASRTELDHLQHARQQHSSSSSPQSAALLGHPQYSSGCTWSFMSASDSHLVCWRMTVPSQASSPFSQLCVFVNSWTALSLVRYTALAPKALICRK